MVLFDNNLPNGSREDALERLHRANFDPSAVMVTAEKSSFDVIRDGLRRSDQVRARVCSDRLCNPADSELEGSICLVFWSTVSTRSRPWISARTSTTRATRASSTVSVARPPAAVAAGPDGRHYTRTTLSTSLISSWSRSTSRSSRSRRVADRCRGGQPPRPSAGSPAFVEEDERLAEPAWQWTGRRRWTG